MKNKNEVWGYVTGGFANNYTENTEEAQRFTEREEELREEGGVGVLVDFVYGV